MNAKTNKIVAVVIIAIGILALLDNLFEGFNFWDFLRRLWPVVLIVLGVYILKSRRGVGAEVVADDGISENTLLGDMDISLSGSEVNGQHYSTLIGDIRIDLTGAGFRVGENRISVFALVGDIRLKIPDGIPVRLSSRSLVGDIEFDDLRRDGFFQRLNHTDDKYESSEKRLRLSVDCLIGDLKVNRINIDDVN
jgi:predicted membrane protein